MPIQFREVKGGTFFETRSFTVSAFPVSHRGPDCVGYTFEERARRPFLSKKADALGIPFGPERGDLVDGKTLVLANGRHIAPDEVLGPLQRGSKLVVIGDVGKTDGLEKYCQDADALVIESTYLNEEAEMARDFSHLTAQQAAELASRANVRHLILTHVSRRYREKDVLKEAQAVHPHVSVARDLQSYQVKRAD